MKKYCYLGMLLSVLGINTVVAQQVSREGFLSGSFETNTIYYLPDSKIKAEAPDDRFGSNNYLKFDYRLGKFAAGLMYEAYLPVLQGMPGELKDGKIVFKYAMFEDRGLNVRVGDFYEQFGSGLLFRAYEDRALGLNTSIEGVRLVYHYGDLVTLKGIYGHPRKYMDRAESQVRGMDLSLNLSSLFDLQQSFLTLEGSFLSRYERYTGTSEDVDASVDGYSFRLGWEYNGFTLKGELVKKTGDAASYNDWKNRKGSAGLVEIGYSGNNLGVLLSGRRLEFMEFRSSRDAIGIGEGVNYLPSLTRQYTYSLANLNPYATQGNGEIGGQVDFYYNFPRDSKLGGRRGMKIALNFSTYYDLKAKKDGDGFEVLDFGDELLFRDLSVDITKTLSPSFKCILMYAMQSFNPLITGHKPAEWKSNLVVLDVTYKLNVKNSFRLELQHLWTEQDQKEWMAGLLEYNMAPRWSVFASDMYNYGDTDLHYYSAGVSYVVSRTRVALNYGRNRAGYNCSGGVCRFVPAYTGFNLSLTTSF